MPFSPLKWLRDTFANPSPDVPAYFGEPEPAPKAIKPAATRLSVVEYLHPSHAREQVAILVRGFMAGHTMTPMGAMVLLREGGNPSSEPGRVLRYADDMFSRSGFPLTEQWIRLPSGKRVKSRTLPVASRDAIRALQAKACFQP